MADQYHTRLPKTAEEIAAEEKYLADMPKTAAEFKAGWLKGFTMTPDEMTNFVSSCCAGFTFHEDTWVELGRIHSELFSCLEHGRVVFDPAVPARAYARLKAARAKADPEFQKVLTRLKRKTA